MLKLIKLNFHAQTLCKVSEYNYIYFILKVFHSLIIQSIYNFVDSLPLDNPTALWILNTAFHIRTSLIIIPVVLKAICQHLLKKAIPEPTERTLAESEEGFSRTWNYPNCVGALDGKHVRIICPRKSASLYYNYKQYFSIVLFALVDSNYKFLAIDVGSYGKEGDAGIYQKSQLSQNIEVFNN